jgi:hypothetical protein
LKVVNSGAVKDNAVGGFIGSPTSQTITITNTLALNPHINAVNGTISVGRVVGKAGIGVESYNGLYALGSMALTADGGTVSVTSSETGKDGESKTDLELSDKNFWISKGFSETVWDFTGLSIAGKVYPKLR